MNQIPANNEIEQYKYFVESCALIQLDNMGVLSAKGADVLDLIDRLSTNDINNLEDNSWIDTVLTTNKGRIVAQIRLLKFSNKLLILSEKNILSEIIEWIDFYTFSEEVEFENISENISVFALIGPKAETVAKKITNLSNTTSDIGTSISTSFDEKDMILNFDQIADIPRIDLVLDKNLNEQFISRLKKQDIYQLTPEIYNVFRIENRLPVHGSELNDKYNPLEANLLSNISFNKGCYVGQEVVARLNTYDKVRMQLVFLYIDKNCNPEKDMIITSDSNQIGALTSFEFSFVVDKWVALAYIKKSYCINENEFFVEDEKGKFKCEIGNFGLTD